MTRQVRIVVDNNSTNRQMTGVLADIIDYILEKLVSVLT